MSPAKMHLLVGEAGGDRLQGDVGEGHPHVVGLGPVQIAEQRAVAEDGPVLAGAQQALAGRRGSGRTTRPPAPTTRSPGLKPRRPPRPPTPPLRRTRGR